jgi:hypothetical protein
MWIVPTLCHYRVALSSHKPRKRGGSALTSWFARFIDDSLASRPGARLARQAKVSTIPWPPMTVVRVATRGTGVSSV